MKYQNVRQAVFLSRPNRFIAHVDLAGAKTVVHVKNTGRCRELLVPGALVWLEAARSPQRKTPWDLIAVQKGSRLINMDAAAPNAVFGEYLRSGGPGFVPELLRPECPHGQSRFDFYYEHQGVGCFTEVKGVTLEEGGVVRFPDAPTLRGVKHLQGLSDCVKEGFEACVVFVVQMQGVDHFEPNERTHPEFAHALRQARDSGVRILAYDCCVRPDELLLRKSVPILL